MTLLLRRRGQAWCEAWERAGREKSPRMGASFFSCCTCGLLSSACTGTSIDDRNEQHVFLFCFVCFELRTQHQNSQHAMQGGAQDEV